MDIDQALSQAEQHILQDQKAQAQSILGEVIRSYPDNEQAWLLSAKVTAKPEQVLYCLRRALKINPNSTQAIQMISMYQQAAPVVVEVAKPQPAMIEPIEPPVEVRSEPDPKPIEPVPTPSSGLLTDMEPLKPRQLEELFSPLVSSFSPGLNPVTIEPGTKKKYKVKWWLLILVLIGVAAYSWSIYNSNNFWPRFDHWQMKTYGNIVARNYTENSEWMQRITIYQSPTLKRDGVILNIALISMVSIFSLWAIRGVIGGIILSIKKLRGGGWIWVLIPVILYPAYLALMGVFGEFAYVWGRNAHFTRKKCPQCQSWIPREATRCQNCGQAIFPVEN
jgi:hypothetical protein